MAGNALYQAEAAFELMIKVFPTESVWEALTTEYRQFVCVTKRGVIFSY